MVKYLPGLTNSVIPGYDYGLTASNNYWTQHLAHTYSAGSIYTIKVSYISFTNTDYQDHRLILNRSPYYSNNFRSLYYSKSFTF